MTPERYRQLRNRSNQLRRRAERKGLELRQERGGCRVYNTADGDKQLMFSGDLDAAERYVATARPRPPWL